MPRVESGNFYKAIMICVKPRARSTSLVLQDVSSTTLLKLLTDDNK